MKVLILKGQKEKGKTETLKGLIEFCFKKYGDGVNQPEPLKISSDDLKYKFKINNKTVVIITLGDYENEIEISLSKCKNDKVDVVVIAERENFSVAEQFCNSQNCEFKVLQKTIADQFCSDEQCNNVDVSTLMSVLLDMC